MLGNLLLQETQTRAWSLRLQEMCQSHVKHEKIGNIKKKSEGRVTGKKTHSVSYSTILVHCHCLWAMTFGYPWISFPGGLIANIKKLSCDYHALSETLSLGGLNLG